MNDDLREPEEPDEPQDSAAAPEPESVNSRKHERKEARIRREQQEADLFWKQVYDTEIGRREMWRLIAGADGAHPRFVRLPGAQRQPRAVPAALQDVLGAAAGARGFADHRRRHRE